MGYVLFAIFGGCGTPWPGWWKGPAPKPQPDPWWVHVVAPLGGILGGTLVQQVIGGAISEPITLLASMFGALATGRVVAGLAVRTFAGAPAVDQVSVKAVA